MGAIRLYFRLVAVSLRGQLQYRASFVMFVIGSALSALIEFIGVWGIFSRFGALDGWTLADAGVFFGLGNIAFALCEMVMREFDVFHLRVRSGEFDRMLLRPRGTVVQMLGAQCQLMRIGRLLQGAAVLGISLSQLGAFGWWGWDRWLLLGLAVLGGALLFAGLIVLQATSAFWTVESLEIWNSFTYGGVTCVQYPLDIYPRPLRRFFLYVLPLAAVNYWPCAYLLGRGYVSPALSWLSPCIGAAFFALSLVVWRAGVLHYRSTGS